MPYLGVVGIESPGGQNGAEDGLDVVGSASPGGQNGAETGLDDDAAGANGTAAGGVDVD